MIFVSLLVGVVAATQLWQAGHPWWAVGAFIFFAGGLWLPALKVLWTILTAPIGLISRRRRTEAHEFRQAAVQAGLFDAASADQLRSIFDAWRRSRAASGISAGEFLNGATDPPLNLSLQERENERALLLPSRQIVLQGFGPVTFWRRGDGSVTWRFVNYPNPGFLAHEIAQIELTREQLRRGEELWFPEYRYEAERN